MSMLHLAAALDGSGRHPAASGRPSSATAHWTGLVRAAERGLLDLVTIEDPPAGARRRGGGPFDAPSVAALTAPLTSWVGLVPAVTAAYAAPRDTAAALAALDRAAPGRAGWRVRTAVSPDAPAPADRWPGGPCTPAAKALVADVLEKAATSVEQVRRTWASGEGPLVVALGHGWDTFRLAARTADVVVTTPHDAFGAAMIAELVRDAERDVGRTGPPLRILADLVVLLDDTVGAARERLDDLDAVNRVETDAAVVATTASGLADLLVAWSGIDGYRLRPARLPVDLDRIADELVPELQRRGAFRTAYAGTTLRDRFGLGERAAVTVAS